MIKNFLYEKEVSYEDSGMEEYELYLIYKKLQENMKTREEVMEFFEPLWEEEV
jgi:hypothetical protein